MNILKIFKDEIPFSVFVDIDEFTERTKGKYYIKVIIYVEKESQKAILIGNAGSKIKKLGELSRKLIEDFLNHSIFLDMYVKVKKNWKNDDAFLKRNFNKLSAAIN
jgi:GTP-binding protein Era